MKRHQIGIFIIMLLALINFYGCACYHAEMSYSIDAPLVKSETGDIPKAIVVFDSWSGNTKLIAETMAEQMECPAVQVSSINEFELKDYDIIVVGSPVHGGMPTNEIDEFLEALKAPRASAVFVTYGAPLFGTLTADRCLDSMAEKLHETCIGKFKCRGFHHIFRTYSDHPDGADKSDAALFAAGLIDRCGKITEPHIELHRPVENEYD